MAGCLAKGVETDEEEYMQHMRLAKKREVAFCMVTLACEAETNKRRLQTERVRALRGQEQGK